MPMTPSLPIPTDNIYKFLCLFGLVLIVTSIFAFVAIYTSSLETKIKYTQTIISLEAKEKREPAEDNWLKEAKAVMVITRINEKIADYVIGAVFAIGFCIGGFGGFTWYNKIQKRDDMLGRRQLEKIEIEIALLRIELLKTPLSEGKQ